MRLRLTLAVLLVLPVAVVTITCGAVCIVLAALAWPFSRIQSHGRAFFESVGREIRSA